MPYNRKVFSDDYATETFYFPLSVQVEDEDSEDLYNVSSDSVRWFEDEIQAAIDDYQSDIEMEKYLCDDNDEVQRKLISAEWGVETLNGELYGRMKLTLKEPLESFEQHPITLDDEKYYVSFWNSGDDYFVYTTDEMDEYLSQQSGQNFGGM